MSVPKVVIVGRPNVGKSSLLNWLSRKRVSVVEPTAGVTRDRVMYLMHVDNRYFELVDTGGIGIVDSDDLSADIERQIDIAIDEATLILLVVDGNTGLVPLDQEVAKRVRETGKPVLMVVNKCDSERTDAEAGTFQRLLKSPFVVTSVKANRNREALVDAIVHNLPKVTDEEQDQGYQWKADPELKLAVVGRRNVGKSTFINALAETERMIVSEIPGTTRDSVDVRFELDGKAFVAIDTPGVRKKKSLANDIEYYGLTRALRSVRRADVVLMFFDSGEWISQVDKQLVGEIQDEYKPCIFVVNKWDLAKDKSLDGWEKYLQDEFPYMRHVPVAFITAQQGRNIKQLINLAQTMGKQARLRLPTSKINTVVRAAVKTNRPPMRAGKQPRVFYATQVGVSPPTIVLKCNFPDLLDRTWQRYLLGVFREETPFREVPIKLYVRGRGNLGGTASLEELEDTDPLLNSDIEELSEVFEQDDADDDVEFDP